MSVKIKMQEFICRGIMILSFKDPFVKRKWFNTDDPDPAEIIVERINKDIEVSFCNGGWDFQQTIPVLPDKIISQSLRYRQIGK